MTEDFANASLTLPKDVGLADVGVYNYAYKVYLVDYPTVITS